MNSRKLLRLASLSLIALASARADDAPPALQDFREVPLKYQEELKERNLTPKINEEYIRDRLLRIIRSVDIDQKWTAPTAASMRPRKALSFHIVVRINEPSDPAPFSRFDLPYQGKDQSQNAYEKIPQYNHEYRQAFGDAASFATSILGLRGELDPSRADLLIYVNLTNRQQASADFTFETMPTLLTRRDAAVYGGDTRNLSQLTYALPWTFVRLYYRSKGTDIGVERAIEGGEIWIQYPTRTYWQETVARNAIDDLKFAHELGLGDSRRDILDAYRTPHKTILPELVTTLRQQRLVWEGPRPRENLLTLAVAARQEYEVRGPSAAPTDKIYDTICAGESHSATIGARLKRALILAAGGLRSNALLVSPAGDYTAEYQRDPDVLLADLSLQGYGASFDIRVDDLLAVIAARAAREAHGNRLIYDLPTVPWSAKHPTPISIIQKMQKEKRSEILDALNRVAKSFTDNCGHQPIFLRRAFGLQSN